MRLRHFSPRTEEAYVNWMCRYYEFHGRRDPAPFGAEHVTAFLNDLATCRRVAASTQNQALSALLFLYREVLGRDLPWLDELVRAKRPARVPVVLARDEVRVVLSHMEGVPRLMATLLYGSGLRLLECCRLRVKDVDFAQNQILVRNGKGDRDRATVLPATIRVDLAAHFERVREQHRATSLRTPAGSSSRARWPASFRPPAGSVPGNGSSRPRASTSTRKADSTGDTTSTRPSSSRLCEEPSSRRGSRRGPTATPFATPSLPISSRTEATSGPSKSCSVTRTSRRR